MLLSSNHDNHTQTPFLPQHVVAETRMPVIVSPQIFVVKVPFGTHEVALAVEQ